MGVFIEAKGGFFVGLVVLSLLALRLPQRLLYRSRRQVRGRDHQLTQLGPLPLLA